MRDTDLPDMVDLHLEIDDQDGMPPITTAEAVLHAPEGAAEEDIALRVTYANGTVVTQPYATAEGVLDIVANAADEFYIVRRNRTIARDQGLDAIVDAINLWLGVEVQTQDTQGQVMHDVRIWEGSLLFKYGEDHTVILPLEDAGLPLRAIWLDGALLGLAHSADETQPAVDEITLGPIVARLAIIASRVAGEWQVVADECVRLGSQPPTGLKPGDHVKIGIQPVHPLPSDYRAEWMWVMLTSVEDGGASLKGTLQNEPGTFAIDLSHGDEIAFSNRDIFAVEPVTIN